MMKQFLDNLFIKNPVLAGYIGIGPILLLSNRLIYALVFSGFYLAYFSLTALTIWLTERYVAREIRFAAKLLLAASFIALGDIIITSTLPLIRADIGILLPVILASTHLYLPRFLPAVDGSMDDRPDRVSGEDSGEDTGEDAAESGGDAGPGALYGSLFGFVVVFILLSLARELLAYGAVDLNPRPWSAPAGGPGALLLFSGGFGLLLFIAYAKALFAKVVR
jgi:hypothetical protein